MTKPITNAERAERAVIGLLEYALGKEGAGFFEQSARQLSFF